VSDRFGLNNRKRNRSELTSNDSDAFYGFLCFPCICDFHPGQTKPKGREAVGAYMCIVTRHPYFGIVLNDYKFRWITMRWIAMNCPLITVRNEPRPSPQPFQ
jgi:hypothetical protein